MSIRIVSFALVASITSLTGCAAELPQPGSPHPIVGFAVAGEPSVPTSTPPRSRIETPTAAPHARVMVFVRGPDAEPMRKHGGR